MLCTSSIGNPEASLNSKCFVHDRKSFSVTEDKSEQRRRGRHKHMESLVCFRTAAPQTYWLKTFWSSKPSPVMQRRKQAMDHKFI